MSTTHVTEMSEFLSVCEEIITNCFAYKNAQNHTLKKQTWPKPSPELEKKKPSTTERAKPTTIPLHGSSKDLKPKNTCHKCHEPWLKGHQCKGGRINMVHEEEDIYQSSSESPFSENEDWAQNSQMDESEHEDQSDDNQNGCYVLEEIDNEILLNSTHDSVESNKTFRFYI
ncbi:hypothetical protein CROQUDRAFT_137104 [Cronartium quercuum f. sp. fusiforme G11]|uniref:Uncharacterized protein n=1 Tax=Cronartium quercuum f. sp. fusiforme G11 TaxID=708437 RepID=A0A9P6N8A9_9BASI|nr:hypothetical protein CROQUDRAFT_137104 [Cronartium quercuum f. sp. fusiforme G11]